MQKKKLNLSSIKVGYQNITVYVESPEKEGRLEDSQGFYTSNQAKIFINDAQCIQEQLSTLFHECFHAAFYVYGMKEIITEHDKEEYVVSTLSNAVLQILVDNPKLVDLIVNHGDSS